MSKQSQASSFYGDQPYIWLRGGRGKASAAWMVAKAGENLARPAHWADEQCRSFPFYNRAMKTSSLLAAQDWVRGHFGVTRWAKDPFGGYGPADYVEARLARKEEVSCG